MKEIVPGIYHLQLPPPGRRMNGVNVYLIEGAHGYLLVDTGWNTKESFNSLKQQLANNTQVDLKDISQVVVTHIHPDHYGLAGVLRELSGAELTLHSLEWKFVEPRYVNMDELLQQMWHWLHNNGVPPDELPKLQGASLGMVKFVAPAPPELIVNGNEIISTGLFNFTVIWTPGHSPGHICLYESEQKVLISGDHVLRDITPNIGLNPQSSSNPLGDYLNSLNSVSELEVDMVLPGHGTIFTGLQQRIDELFHHHESRMTEILEILDSKPKTAYEICLEMTWLRDTTINGVRGSNLSPWDRRMAVLEALSHLEKLRVDGKLTKSSKDSIIRYRLSGEASSN